MPFPNFQSDSSNWTNMEDYDSRMFVPLERQSFQQQLHHQPQQQLQQQSQQQSQYQLQHQEEEQYSHQTQYQLQRQSFSMPQHLSFNHDPSISEVSAVRQRGSNSQLVSYSSNASVSSLDPTEEDYDMDGVSVLDSVLLHHASRANFAYNEDDNSTITSTGSTYSNRRTSNYSICESYMTGVILEDEVSTFVEDNMTNFSNFPARPSVNDSFRGLRCQRKSARRVHFAEDALLYSSVIDREDVLTLWYNREELANLKADRKEIVKLLKRYKFNLQSVMEKHGDSVCLRGYEAYFSVEANNELRKNRAAVVAAVLKELIRQKASRSCHGKDSVSSKLSKGSIVYDWSVLSKHASDASRWARDQAARMGKQDENDILNEYSHYYTPGASQLSNGEKKGKKGDWLRSPLWDIAIDKSIEDVMELHHTELAMQFSIIEHEQQMLQQQQMMQQQLMLFANLNNSVDGQSYSQGSSSDNLLQLRMEQLRVLNQHQHSLANSDRTDQFSTANAERLNQATPSALHESSGCHMLLELQAHREQQLRQYHMLQQQSQQQHAQYWHQSVQKNESQNISTVDDYECQQMVQLHQMQLQAQKQEQLQLLAEAQMRLADEIRRNETNSSNRTNCYDEDLDSALRLVAALQVQQDRTM